MFKNKYREKMANITEREWKRVKEDAQFKKMHPSEFIMMCLEITESDCNPRVNADVYWELIEMNNNKLIASNRHKQENGHTDRFWLTKKGYKKLFAE